MRCYVTGRPALLTIIGLLVAASIGIEPVFGALRSSLSGRQIPVSGVEATFGVAPAASHVAGVVVVRELGDPLPYGDLGEYSFYAAKSLKAFESQAPRTIPAALTVFPTVSGATRASIRIQKTGECVAHVDKRYFPLWTKCNHFRVANVLLMTSSDISLATGKALVAALRRLGRPTGS